MLSRDPAIYEKTASKLRGKKRDYIPRYKRRKPVLQYSLDGYFLKEYSGAIEVNKEWEGNIVACCAGKISSAYGYVWRYKASDDYPLKIVVSKNWHISNRPIIQYDKLGNFIAEFKSATIASKITSIGRKAITNCLGGRSSSAGGYVWKYKIMGGISNE